MENFDWRNTISANLKLLRFTGLWPKGYESFKLDLYLLYSLLITFGIIGGHDLSQVLNIFHTANLEELSATIFVAATNTFAIVKRYLFIKNLRLIKDSIVTLNTHEFRPKNSHHLELVEASVKDWKTGYMTLSIGGVINVLLWVVVPALSKESVGGNRKLPFEAWYPFNTEVSPNYEMVYIYQFICISYIVAANVNVDSLIWAFMMFIGIQCEILGDELKNLEDENFHKDLITCIKHHKEILIFAKNINNFFNFIIFGQIAVSTASLALAMFQLSLVDFSSGTAYTLFSYICGMSTEIFFYCWFGNEVEIKSGQITSAVYESRWIDKPKSVTKNLMTLCCKCQKPIKITAMNLFSFSLETFISIIRSAWSYFAVLSTVNNK